ncbi:hypothetical protein KM427_22750 [Nocardioides sp. LMS-CY]|uniref:lipid II flippase MurJ n=1 Tax=Nocardioides sp. (strain LMS-CY) TaxID=2840457 RepID=UPI001C005184|nr:lipid II flippase MurJ [Nocardioides sp. LMS-CY]QWF21711.1 hypothetical protein KM427_22750 [Nocardioides sp. LMS-CY]
MSGGTSAARAGGITTIIGIVNAGVGLVFQAVLAAQLGLGSRADDFQLCWTIVTFLTVTIFSMVPSVLVPRMHRGADRDYALGTWIYPAGLGGVLSVVQCVVAFGVGQGELRTMLLAASPAALLAGLTATPQAVAYLDRRFVVAAVGPVANGVGLVAFVALARNELTAVALGGALTVGYLVQFVATVIPVARRRPRGLRSRGIGPGAFTGLALYTAVAKFQPVLERGLAVSVAPGATAALGLGQKIAQGLLMLAAFGLALTSTPKLAQLAVERSHDRAARVFAASLAGTLLLTSTTLAFALPLAEPMTKLLYERGAFDGGDTVKVAAVVIAQLPWVAACALAGVATTYLYVERMYFRVMVSAGLGLAATAAGSFAIKPFAPDLAVAIGSSLGAVLSCAWSFFLVSRSELRPHLRAALTEYRGVLTSAVLLLATSVTVYGGLSLAEGVAAFLPTVATVVIVALVCAGCLLLSAVRREIKGVLGAEI